MSDMGKIAFITNKPPVIRDNHKCAKCREYGNVAHHLDGFTEYPELRFNVDNGATLYKVCHKRFHRLYSNINNTKMQFLSYIRN